MKKFIILIGFAMTFTGISAQSDSASHAKGYKDSDSTDTWVPVEIDASFPGGQTAWKNFLIANLNNSIAQKAANGSKHFKERAVVEFIIEKDGTISNIKVLNEVHPLIREEAIRVISLSPAWVPAEQKGKKVKAYRVQPLTFFYDK